MNPAKLQRLVAQTPRDQIDAIGYKPFALFRKDRRLWQDAMTHGVLVLAAVVQANMALFRSGNRRMARAVILYTTDPVLRMDGEWLLAVNERVHAVKQDPHPQDPELKEIQNLLLDERSRFHMTLPPSLTWGVATTMEVEVLVPAELPNGSIPEDRLIPLIIGNDGHFWTLKPSAYL
jgi:hypothetical protein